MEKKSLVNNTEKKQDEQGNVTLGINAQSVLDISTNFKNPAKSAMKLREKYKMQTLSPIKSMDSDGLHELLAKQDHTQFREEQSVSISKDDSIIDFSINQLKKSETLRKDIESASLGSELGAQFKSKIEEMQKALQEKLNLTIEKKKQSQLNKYQRPKGLKQVLEERQIKKQKSLLNVETIKYVSRADKVPDYSDTDSEGDGKQLDPETGVIEYKDTQGNITRHKPNEKFIRFKYFFQNMLKSSPVITQYEIISMCLANDSSCALAVTKRSEFMTYIVIYCLKTHELIHEEKLEGDCIKAKEVEQNADGSQFAIMYLDDGRFRLRFFTKQSLDSEEDVEYNTVYFNELLNINNDTMPIHDFPDPYCTCAFISDTQVFVNLFHGHSQTHYHFIWDTNLRNIIGIDGSKEPIAHKMDCLPSNFPYKSFYSDDNKELYCFYRDGQAFTIKQAKLDNYRLEKITDRECGQMVLVYDQAVIIRSSTKILFFQQVFNKIKEVKEWKLYHEMSVRGMIFYTKGNIRIQVTTPEYIYFYLIDKETFMPDLENVMENYMSCNQLMVGKRVRNAISYKTNETSFVIYKRRSMHNLRVCVNGDNFESCKVLELETSNVFLVSQIDKVYMMDSDTFQVCGQIPVQLLPTETREPNEIVGMVKSEDENYIAIISGKNLVMNEQKQNQLFIFKRKPAITDFDYDDYEQYKRIVIKDIPIFKKVVMQYYFKITKRGKPPDSLVFARSDMIFELDYESHTVTKVYQMQQICNLQPQFFLMDPRQEIAVIASDSDGIWIDRESFQFVDLDLLFGISMIKCVIYDDEDENFYLLCNKKEETLGFFLIKFSKSDPKDFLFVTMVRHNLDIGNVNMFISRGKSDGKVFKELIIGYKMIFINTYTVLSIDISDIEQTKEGIILHKHESFQLWEAEVSGHLLKHQLDYMSLSKSGINILALGPNPKHDILDFEGNLKTIHSLDCLNWLKCSKENLITYQCQYYDDRVISIDQEYAKGKANDDISHYYYNVYKIKIHEVTLRELLLIQSMYLASTIYDVQTLIKLQPKPQFFYKSFLELDCANLVYILSFDSTCIRAILDEKYEDLFPQSDYPLIYMNKFLKKNGKGFFLQNSIDLALISNQIGAVNKLIEYIVKYQNNYVSSYLFQKNIVTLLERGVHCCNLTDSNIFSMQFDYDDWPAVHNDHTECLRAYCGSFADIRDSYRMVFPEARFEPKVKGEVEEKTEEENLALSNIVPFQDQDEDQEETSNQFVQIKYTVNLLAQASFHIQHEIKEDLSSPTFHVNSDTSLMKILSTTEELDLLTTRSVNQVIQFKWREFGRKHHMLGFIMQVFYIFVFMQYIMGVYVRNSKAPKGYLPLLAIGIAFPITYDVIQISRVGLKVYLENPWNKADFASYVCNFLNFVMQSSWGHDNGFSRLLMCLIVLFQIVKCFFFLRLFNSLTPIIVMLKNVVYDLRIFLMFYGILIFMMGQCYAIIGLGNNYEKVEDTYIDHKGVNKTYMRRINPAAGTEHFAIGLHWAEILWTLRFSMGDNTGIGIMKKVPNPTYHQEPFKLEGADNWIFWTIWLITVVVTCIIFLNFIVAEASASYSKVTEMLNQVINQEMASLIAEAETMSPKQFVTTKNYPQFIISREVDY